MIEIAAEDWPKIRAIEKAVKAHFDNWLNISCPGPEALFRSLTMILPRKLDDSVSEKEFLRLLPLAQQVNQGQLFQTLTVKTRRTTMVMYYALDVELELNEGR